MLLTVLTWSIISLLLYIIILSYIFKYAIKLLGLSFSKRMLLLAKLVRADQLLMISMWVKRHYTT